MHVYLIGLYSKYIIQQKLGGAIIKNNVSLTCMMVIDPVKGWFEIVEIPTYDLDKVMDGNDLFQPKMDLFSTRALI